MARVAGSITDAFVAARKALARVVSRVVPPADIEDVVQETFVRSYEAELARRIEHPRAFLMKTAYHLALNHVDRSEHRLADSLESLVAAEDARLAAAASPERELESREQLLLFCRAVRELPLQCRRAFLLKKVYGMSQREIARYLGISESTVEKHVARGILGCWRYLDAHGLAPSAAARGGSEPPASVRSRRAAARERGNAHG